MYNALRSPRAITLSDSVDAGPMLAFTCTVGGTLSFDALDGNTYSMNVVAGTVYPIAVKRFRVTGTTGVGGVLAWQ